MTTEIKDTEDVEANMSKLFASDGENEESQIIIPKKMKKEEPEEIKQEEPEEIEIEDPEEIKMEEPEEIKLEETEEIKMEEPKEIKTEVTFLRRSGRATKKTYVPEDSDSDTMNEQTPDVTPVKSENGLKTENFGNLSIEYIPNTSPGRADMSDEDSVIIKDLEDEIPGVVVQGSGSKSSQ